MLVPLLTAQLLDESEVDGVGAIGGLKAYFDLSAEQLSRNVPGSSSAHVAFVVRASFAAVLSSVLFRDWLFRTSNLAQDDMSAQLAEFMLRGIGTLDGTP